MEKIDSFRGEYFFLSNFYEIPVTYDGITYENNEAAFQAQKVAPRKTKKVLSDERLAFCHLNPSEAKKFGRKIPLRKDWEAIKVKVMEDIVLAKFSQHPELAEKLLATGNAHLEEGNSWGDKVWGTVGGVGANNLGKILMRVRETLREREKKGEHTGKNTL